jgi:hypothetical protein
MGATREAETPEQREFSRTSALIRMQQLRGPKLTPDEGLRQKLADEKAEREKRIQQILDKPSSAFGHFRSSFSTPDSAFNHASPSVSPVKKMPRTNYADSGASALRGVESFYHATTSLV